MIYAIVEDDKVVNIVEANARLGSDWYMTTPNSPVAIGDTFDGKNFYDADGRMRLPPDMQTMQESIDILKTENEALKASLADYEAAYAEGVQEA